MIAKRKLRRRVIQVIFAAATPFVLLFGYGFLAGMTDAARGNRWLSPQLSRAAEIYHIPAVTFAYAPLIGNVIKLGDYLGYDFVGGPETTR